MLLFYSLLFFVTAAISREIIELIRFPTGQFNGSTVISSSHIEFTVILHTHLLSINLSDVQCHLNCLHHHVLQICTITDYSQDCRNVTKSVYSYTLSFPRERELDQTLSFQIYLRTEQGTGMIEEVPHLLVEERNIAWRLVDHSLPSVHQFVAIVEEQQQLSPTLTGWIIGSMTAHHRDLFLSLSLKDMRMIVSNDMELSLCETSIGVHVTCCSLSSSTPCDGTTANGGEKGNSDGNAVVPDTTRRQLVSCLPPSADIGILLLHQHTTIAPISPNYNELVYAAVNTVRGTVYVFSSTMQSLSDTLQQLPVSLRSKCSFLTLLDGSGADHHHHHSNNDGNNNNSNNHHNDGMKKISTTTIRESVSGGSGAGSDNGSDNSTEDNINNRKYYSCTQSRISHASMTVSDILSMQVIHWSKGLHSP